MSESVHGSFLPFAFQLSIRIAKNIKPVDNCSLKGLIKFISQVVNDLSDYSVLVTFMEVFF
jgi:hypothetical protein